ncbi:MAG: ComEC/Rec2 family competence protein, partial [Bifidobacteriaceae bacterium]|nr:ComEC/Rec2 family competence protein [Bifidobacteriaceae bacterium]
MHRNLEDTPSKKNSAQVSKFPAQNGLDLRLALPTAVAWAVLAAFLGAPREVTLTVGLALLAVGLVLNWRLPPHRTTGALVVLVLVVAGFMLAGLGIQGWVWSQNPLVQAAERQEQSQVTLRLSEPARARASPWGGANSVTARGVVFAGAEATGKGVPALAYFSGEAPAAGAVLTFSAQLEPAEPAASERVVLRVLASPQVEEPTGWRGLVYRLRAGLESRGSPLLVGIAVGDTGGVNPELDAALKTTALTHITAVSGAHVAIVLGLVLGICTLARTPRPVAAAAAVATLVSFTVLVGPSPSVLRAVAMGGA